MKRPPMPASRSFLSEHRLPRMAFTRVEAAPDVVRPLWRALHNGDTINAVRMARNAATHAPLASATEEAARLVGIAAAFARGGHTELSRGFLDRSLQVHPQQWAAHRLSIELLESIRDTEAVFLYLSELIEQPPVVPAWDEPLQANDRHLAVAALAWSMRDWNSVADHLALVHVGAGARLPDGLLDDHFRATLYARRPDDAATVAERLLEGRTPESADSLLHVFTQQGWMAHALALYRHAFSQHPTSALLRRRLVGLCIREGAIDEARRLTRNSALDLAA